MKQKVGGALTEQVRLDLDRQKRRMEDNLAKRESAEEARQRLADEVTRRSGEVGPTE